MRVLCKHKTAGSNPAGGIRSFSSVGRAPLLYSIMYAQVGGSPGFNPQKEQLFFNQRLVEQELFHFRIFF